jgi:ferredoxin
MMISIKVDPEACQGYGNCVLAMPSVFDIDDAGQVVLLAATAADGQLDDVQRAVQDCPTNAITFTASP